jgi:hypothetical protein
MSIPTSGETFSQLIEHIAKAQEAAAMMAHLDRANDSAHRAQGWLAVSEMFKLIRHQVTKLATRGMH